MDEGYNNGEADQTYSQQSQTQINTRFGTTPKTLVPWQPSIAAAF